MTPFKTLDAVAAPMALPNVDTDQIIPARYLWRARADGYGAQLFHDLRYEADGTPRPDFVLNHPSFSGASIIVGNANFGCGSSREAAVWALADYGIRCVIAPSFGDIFFNNCFKNGLLPIVMDEDLVAALRQSLDRKQDVHIEIDLVKQIVTGPGGREDHFSIDPFRKQMLIDGTDDITLTLQQIDAIKDFEAAYDTRQPWL